MLAAEGFDVLPPARVRGLIPRAVDPEKIQNRYVFNSLMSWEGNDANLQQLAPIRLSHILDANRARLTETVRVRREC